ncbi:O-methyltransferase [bacterium]|nr:O-methyltransferase [bacterium]MBR1776691.1 O-methyltransferase [bacterium]
MDILIDETTSNVLKELEKTQKDFWNIPRKTGILLNMFVKMMNAKSVLEIGTSNGYSGLWLAKALKETGGKLTTIEFYDKRQSIAKENFKICGVEDIVIPLQGSACDVIKSFDDSDVFDFVFIDANKREYVEYFNLVKPHLTRKAMIVADNIISHAQKVQTFIDAVDADEEFQYEIVEVPGGILVAYRNS